MAGLLSGIGQVLAGGVAGGAKAAGESFVEQAKQEALAAREENMLRIQNLFAKAGRAETMAHAERMTNKTIASQEKLAGQTQVGANIRQEASLTSTENLAEIERLSRSEEALAEREARVTAVAKADTTARKFETFKAGLPGELKKKFDDLKNILGPEKAKDVFTDIISRKDTAYETIVAKMTKDIDPMDLTEDKVKKIAEIALTFAQLKTRETTAAPGESAFARAKREKAEKPAAGEKTGLLAGETAALDEAARPEAAKRTGPVPEEERLGLLAQRKAGRVAEYDKKYAELQRQGKATADIHRLIGKRPALD